MLWGKFETDRPDKMARVENPLGRWMREHADVIQVRIETHETVARSEVEGHVGVEEGRGFRVDLLVDG